MENCQQIVSTGGERGAAGVMLCWWGSSVSGQRGVAWTASGRTDSQVEEGVEAAYLGHTSVSSPLLDVPTKTTINKNYIWKIGLHVQITASPNPTIVEQGRLALGTWVRSDIL